MSRLIATFSLVILSACSGTSLDLPPITGEATGQRHPGKFIWHDLISDKPAASRAFYSELLDWSFRRLPLATADYWVISHAGVPIGGMVDQVSLATDQDVSQWISLVSVEDSAQTRDRVLAAGGSVLREPVSLGKRGTIAVYNDAQGGIFASLQTTEGDPLDRETLAPQGSFFWHELWTRDVSRAATFYASLNDLEVELPSGIEGDSEVEYRVLRGDGQPRAGIRSLPLEDMPTLWMPYLRTADRESLQALLARVPDLGGEVLVPATARPAGGFVAVIAGPSGAPVALQSWDESMRQRSGE